LARIGAENTGDIATAMREKRKPLNKCIMRIKNLKKKIEMKKRLGLE